MKKFTHLGFNNWVNTTEIDAVQDYNSSPATRYVQQARQRYVLVDVTKGRRTKSVITMKSGNVIISAMAPDTVVGRLEGLREREKEE